MLSHTDAVTLFITLDTLSDQRASESKGREHNFGQEETVKGWMVLSTGELGTLGYWNLLYSGMCMESPEIP